MKITHDSVTYANRYGWGEPYVLSFISEIYKYRSFLFKSNKQYYIDGQNPSIHIEENTSEKRKIKDRYIVLVNVTKSELRKITKYIFKYVE